MNFIQEVLNLLERKEDKKKLDLKRDWFEFGRTRPSSVGNPLYTPKMNPHAIRYDDLKCNIISGLVSGTGTEHTLPMWSVIDKDNCNVQTIIDSIFSQDAGATEGKVSGDFRVTGNTVLEGNLLVLGTQTIVESTIVQVADNIMQINSGGGAFDAGIEVIQPSGTKTWAWDNANNVWSTFNDSIITKDIIIQGAIKQDGATLTTVVNEAEGLASSDNDNSYATVAAIIDWTDRMDLDVSADTGTPLDILLNSETLEIRGGSNITTNADGATKIRIDLDDDIVVNSVTSNNLTLLGAPGTYNVTSIVNNIIDAVNADDTLPTVKAIIDYVDTERDYISNVTLTGTDLTFTGVNNAFSGSIDLSGFVDEYTIVPDLGPTDGSYGIISLFKNGVSPSNFNVYGNEWIEIFSDGVKMDIHHKPGPDLLAAISDVTLNHGDTFSVQSYAFDSAGHVIDLASVNYTLPTITDESSVYGAEYSGTLDYPTGGSADVALPDPVIFTNTSGQVQNYHITITTENRFSSPTLVDEFIQFKLTLASIDGANSATIGKWDNVYYAKNDSVFTKTYTATAMNINPGAQIYPWIIAGNAGLSLKQLHISIIPFSNDALALNKISIP